MIGMISEALGYITMARHALKDVGISPTVGIALTSLNSIPIVQPTLEGYISMGQENTILE